MIRIMDSHAYPGCPALVDKPLRDGPAHVEFSDGIVANARVAYPEESRMVLTIAAYKTARGNPIAEKSWLLEHSDGDRWRVRRRHDAS
jgi:hypothetical protein